MTPEEANPLLSGLFTPWGMTVTLEVVPDGYAFKVTRGQASMLGRKIPTDDAWTARVTVEQLVAFAARIERLPGRVNFVEMVFYDIVKILP